jgi:hypothetical protein
MSNVVYFDGIHHESPEFPGSPEDYAAALFVRNRSVAIL